MGETIVRVRDLKKVYGTHEAVKGVSFSIEKGEIYGIVGPNGAGKTSILRTLATALNASSGSVEIDGLDIERESRRIRTRISYLPEEAGAYKSMTGRQYLAFSARFYTSRENVTDMVGKGVEIAALGDAIDRKTGKYSKGMLRRLLLARTLMTDPVLVLLDEPTSGLDVINSRNIRDVILEEARNGRTFILSSHNMFELEILCTRISLMNKGRILHTGRPVDITDHFGKANLEDVFTELV